jgi:CRISPR/Cas system-associated exonuclease Cas4 (RecB family)
MEKPKHHPTFPPSKLDILAVCPFFKTGEAGEAAQKGTDQHEYAELLLHGDWKGSDEYAKNIPLKLSSEDRDNVQWYVDYVRANASGKLEIEQRFELEDSAENIVTFGTIDAGAGPDIFDYKSDREQRPHKFQMAAYALMWMKRKKLPSTTAHICYGRLRKVVKFTFTQEEAADMVETVQAIYYNPERKHTPSEYCSWCKLAVECPALTSCVSLVARKVAPEQEILLWSINEVSDPNQVSRMLIVARIATAWADAVEKHAKLMMKIQGVEIPGWSLLERSGGREVKNILKAYELCDISQEAFLKSCKVVIGSLEEIYAKEKGIKKAEAKRLLKDLLAEVSEEKKPFAMLVKNKGE